MSVQDRMLVLPLCKEKIEGEKQNPKQKQQRAYEQDLPPCATGVTLA